MNTDLERSKKEFEENIFDGLDWLGIQFDEGPKAPLNQMQYRQSEQDRTNIYNKYIDQLIASGDAYYCFETDES